MADAVAGSELKGAPRAFDRIQRVFGADEPPVGQEIVRTGPEGRVAVQGLVVGPDEEAVGGETMARAEDGETGVAGARRRGSGEEAKGFFDDGEGEGGLVEEMRGGTYADGNIFQGGAEDRAVFCAEPREGSGRDGEEMKDVAYRAAGGVVAGKNEEFDLTDGEGRKRGVHGLRGRGVRRGLSRFAFAGGQVAV